MRSKRCRLDCSFAVTFAGGLAAQWEPGFVTEFEHAQRLVDKRIVARVYSREHGDDIPEVRDWMWPAAHGAAFTSSEHLQGPWTETHNDPGLNLVECTATLGASRPNPRIAVLITRGRHAALPVHTLRSCVGLSKPRGARSGRSRGVAA